MTDKARTIAEMRERAINLARRDLALIDTELERLGKERKEIAGFLEACPKYFGGDDDK